MHLRIKYTLRLITNYNIDIRYSPKKFISEESYAIETKHHCMNEICNHAQYLDLCILKSVNMNHTRSYLNLPCSWLSASHWHSVSRSWCGLCPRGILPPSSPRRLPTVLHLYRRSTQGIRMPHRNCLQDWIYGRTWRVWRP